MDAMWVVEKRVSNVAQRHASERVGVVAVVVGRLHQGVDREVVVGRSAGGLDCGDQPLERPACIELLRARGRIVIAVVDITVVVLDLLERDDVGCAQVLDDLPRDLVALSIVAVHRAQVQNVVRGQRETRAVPLLGDLLPDVARGDLHRAECVDLEVPKL